MFSNRISPAPNTNRVKRTLNFLGYLKVLGLYVPMDGARGVLDSAIFVISESPGMSGFEKGYSPFGVT